MTSASLSPAAPPTPAQRTGPRSGTTATERIRLFVGGLPADVTAEELQMRFQPFGKVIGSEIVPQKEDGANCRGFGYVDLEPVSEASLSKCFAVVSGTVSFLGFDPSWGSFGGVPPIVCLVANDYWLVMS